MIAALLLAARRPDRHRCRMRFRRATPSASANGPLSRKYADRDAVMFTPQAVWARDFLKGRKNPPKAVRWWPATSFVSCDGRTAVNTGPWIGPATARGTAISPPCGSAKKANGCGSMTAVTP